MFFYILLVTYKADTYRSLTLKAKPEKENQLFLT